VPLCILDEEIGRRLHDARSVIRPVTNPPARAATRNDVRVLPSAV
jgi:hypothetical protein